MPSLIRPKSAAGGGLGRPRLGRRGLGGSGGSGARSRASISSSTASGSLTPPGPKNLIPLSLAGLWLAEMTTPNAAPRVPVR